MKYIEKYLKDIIKVKPLGTLTTKEDELDGISGEMVYIGGKCSNIFISRIDYANWLEKQVPIDEEKVLIGARKDIALSIMNFLDRCTTGMCLSNMECADLESAVVDSDWSKVYDYMKKKLDKQGKQKSLDYENINIQQKDFAPKSAMEAIKEEKIDNTNKVEPKDYSSIDPHFFKTTDKVETKFKVGDFIVNDYCSGKVVKITDDAYLLDTGQGIPFSCEHNVHLWNVTKDAKDGDVLCCESGWTCIFKTLNSNNISFSSYCFMDNTGWFCETGSESHTLEKAFIKAYNGEIYPATKEQRDLLFAKMKEAGYDWDTEKKELKKIELKSDGEVEHLIPQKGIYYTCIKDYYSSDNTHLYVKGNIYKSSFNGYIDDESHFGLSWTNSCTEKYFEPTKDEDWIVCEHDNVIGKPMQYKEFKEKVNQKFIENLKSQGLTPKLRLWNLQDDKAGDVLAISWWEDNNFWEKIIIFKKYHNKGVKGLYYMPCVEGYGNTFKNGKLVFNEKVLYYSKTWTCNLHPATKEQRDTLMKAMADAGYTSDFEKKELKKLGQSEVTKMSDQEEIAEIPFGAKDSELQEATYFIPKGFHAEIDDDKVVIKKDEKPTAWSEEDEQITLSIEQVMNCASLLNIVPEKMDKIRAWLKSLKDRCTWKPSSLQMECLHDAIKHYHTNGYPASKLKELYEQMSKIYKL